VSLASIQKDYTFVILSLVVVEFFGPAIDVNFGSVMWGRVPPRFCGGKRKSRRTKNSLFGIGTQFLHGKKFAANRIFSWFSTTSVSTADLKQ